MSKRVAADIIATIGTAVILTTFLGAASTSAMTAAKSWTVKPGGQVTASGPLAWRDTTTGTITACHLVKLAATMKSGSGLAGADIGSVTSAALTRCELLGSTGGTSLVAHGLPWKLNATSYNVHAGVTTGTIAGIDLTAATTECVATLDGTGAGKDDGEVEFTYTNSTGKLKLLPQGSNLHWWGITGCFGLLNDGDPVQPRRSLTVTPQLLTVTPRQTIASP